MRNGISTAASVVLLALFSPAGYAITGACSAKGSFSANVSSDWTQDQNVTGRTLQLPTPLTGNAYQIECTCEANTKVGLFYTVTSGLSQTGKVGGYYHLNNNLDIQTEVDDIPGVTGVTPLNTQAIRESGAYQSGGSNGSVCAADPADTRAAPVTIGANTRLTFYVTKPFLGELVIPDTLVASVRAGWSTNTTPPSLSTLQDIAELRIQGSITVPQNCKINQGDIIRVDLGFINVSRFTTKDRMPDGYTPVKFEIRYDCGDTSEMGNDMEMQIDSNDVVNQYTLVARRRETDNVPDVGIQMSRDGSQMIPFTNGLLSLDSSGQGAISLEAWPINMVGGTLSPGKYSGTATITVIVK